MAGLRKTFPEASRFWKSFEGALKNDRDMPWPSIRSQSYLQPEFFGLSVALVLGDATARDRMEDHFASFVEPPEGGRYDKVELVRRIMVVADKAASEAAGSDRAAGLADRRLVESRIRSAANEVRGMLESLEGGVARVEGRLDEQAAANADFAAKAVERLDEIVDLVSASGSEHRPPAVDRIDRVQMQELLDQQAQKFAQINEASIAKIFGHKERLVDTVAAEAAEATPFVDDAAPGREDHDRNDDVPKSGSNHIDALAESHPTAAKRLRDLYLAGGVFAVATAIRNDDLAGGPPDLLVAAARVVAECGFAADAEAAYLSAAAQQSLTPADQARQYVRAASMAAAQDSDERSLRHLDSARALAPDHPALLIAEARRSTDPRFMLAHVADVEPESVADNALLHQTDTSIGTAWAR